MKRFVLIAAVLSGVLLAGYAALEERFVVFVEGFDFVEVVKELLRGGFVRDLFAALAVAGALLADVFHRGVIEAIAHDRVSRGIFVDVRGAMTNPLPGDEDRHHDEI